MKRFQLAVQGWPVSTWKVLLGTNRYKVYNIPCLNGQLLSNTLSWTVINWRLYIFLYICFVYRLQSYYILCWWRDEVWFSMIFLPDEFQMLETSLFPTSILTFSMITSSLATNSMPVTPENGLASADNTMRELDNNDRGQETEILWNSSKKSWCLRWLFVILK